MSNGSTIHFALFPVRVVSPASAAFTYIDGHGKPQRADSMTEIVDSGVRGVVYHTGPVDNDELWAVRSVLVMIAIERHRAGGDEFADAALAGIRGATDAAREKLAGDDAATAENVRKLLAGLRGQR